MPSSKLCYRYYDVNFVTTGALQAFTPTEGPIRGSKIKGFTTSSNESKQEAHTAAALT